MNIRKMDYVRGVAFALAISCFCLAGCASSPEAKRAKYLEAGKKLLKNKDTSRAILQFQNAVKVAPKDAEAYYQLGEAFLASSDIPHGVASLRKALELDPKHPNARLQLARLMLIVDDKDTLRDAANQLHSLLQEAPNNAEALQTLALTELKLGDSEAAIRDLSHAVSAAPQEVMVAATLAHTKFQQGDAKGAEEVLKTASKNAPTSSDAHVILGRFFMWVNRTADAEKELRQALMMKPGDPAALYDLGTLQLRTGRLTEAEETFRVLSKGSDKATKPVLGEFLYRQGRKEEAVKEFERLALADPGDRAARTRLAAIYQAVNREQDAEKVLAMALKKNPKDLDALLQRAELYLLSKRFSEAEADLNAVVHLQPDSPEVHYILGKLFEARGERGRYRQELSKALELNPFILPIRLELAQVQIRDNGAQAALDILNSAPPSQADSLEILAGRNWALWAKGDMAGMRKGIDQGLSSERSADFLLQDGMWKLRSGNATGARASLEEALKINPADVRTLSVLMESYDVQKQTTTALDRVKEYAAREPRSVSVQLFLGTILLARGDRAGARNAFQAAKVADPHSMDADLSLMQADLVDGKLDDAQHRLEGVIAANPSNTNAHLWLGAMELMRSDFGRAEKQFRIVLAAEPDNSQALNNLAFLMAENGGQPSEALKYAQKAKELAPDKPEYSDTLGWILYKQGLYPSAVQELEHATAQRSKPIWEYHLAMAYAKAGDNQHARSVLDKALKQAPELPEAKLAQQVVGVGKLEPQ